MTERVSKLRFRRRPSPVLPEHRPLYKIGQTLLILQIASHGGKSRLARLHLLNWALKRPERQVQLITASKSKRLAVEAWGFDPALAIAIRFAISEELIEETSTGYGISESGKDFVQLLTKDEEVFVGEKNFLRQIGKGVTEAMVEKVASGWEKS
ncbi:hypothetical protein F1609_20260 [Massilia sp. CCM 8693]|uniref:Uncharacterized protein n=1 Tax=Massilia aquatica TaxID=2609000 RepID=A0ABX0M858_9BURK|nr:hypothetical protein [Massilia aquatica]